MTRTTSSTSPGRRRCLSALGTLGAFGMLGGWSMAPFASGLASPVSALASGRVAGSAPRVVSLSWAGAQILVSLGIVPIGIAERADYPLSGALPAMPASVLELGTHSEPNLELLQQIKPDLIVIDANQSDLAPRLSSIAPTVTIDIYNAQRGRPFARAVAETQRLGALLGREEVARRYLKEVDAQLAACAATVSTLTAAAPVLIVDLYDDGRHLYLYGPNSMTQDAMDRLGVRNAWSGSTDSGYLLLGIEGLATMGDAQMYYISHGERDQIALHNLSRSVLWQHLPFVQTQRFVPLPGFFAYGATSCAVQFARELTAGMVALDRQKGRGRG
ncbi:ABC transporter substrate-binding protein [Paraburkholderia sp. BCC1885]|uniref:ABC transporter substrate-binding protein n=1 Tax=Paraburkholderia sp. BCC1885 TaxID=2562669 RepID=UPI001642ECF0|nr:ABC transporter substrate-binding protein [Paraburkholderia sp. BCC1885]